MERARSLFGRILWGGRHWTQAPIGQSPTSPTVLLIGWPRERSLAGEAPERSLVGIERERSLVPRGEQ